MTEDTNKSLWRPWPIIGIILGFAFICSLFSHSTHTNDSTEKPADTPSAKPDSAQDQAPLVANNGVVDQQSVPAQKTDDTQLDNSSSTSNNTDTTPVIKNPIPGPKPELIGHTAVINSTEDLFSNNESIPAYPSPKDWNNYTHRIFINRGTKVKVIKQGLDMDDMLANVIVISGVHKGQNWWIPFRYLSDPTKGYLEQTEKLLDDGRPEAALEVSKKAVSANSRSAIAYEKRAETKYWLSTQSDDPTNKKLVRLMQDAIVDCSHAIKLDPKYSTAYAWRGFLEGELTCEPPIGDDDAFCKRYNHKALADLTKAIQLDPNNPRLSHYYHIRAKVYSDLGDSAKGYKDEDTATKLGFRLEQGVYP